jgi:hypothetical protein
MPCLFEPQLETPMVRAIRVRPSRRPTLDDHDDQRAVAPRARDGRDSIQPCCDTKRWSPPRAVASEAPSIPAKGRSNFEGPTRVADPYPTKALDATVATLRMRGVDTELVKRAQRLRRDAGPDGRRRVAAIFTRLDVAGFERLEDELTADALDLGLDAALPPILKLESQIGEFGRGERI